jgi:hypothetical protein
MLPVDERNHLINATKHSSLPERAPMSTMVSNATPSVIRRDDTTACHSTATTGNNNKRGSVHTQMFVYEQQRSSIIDLPLVMATLDDSMNSLDTNDDVFYSVSNPPTIAEEGSDAENIDNENDTPDTLIDDGNSDVVKIDTATSSQAPVTENHPSMANFLNQHRTVLPAGVRAEFRRLIFQNQNSNTNLQLSVTPPADSTSSYTQTFPTFEEEKQAIESMNPWFQYNELFHRCRTDYNFHHRTIDMLSAQPFNKDILRELLVLLYGQRYMIRAPDLHTEWNDFITEFWKFHQYQSEHLWIDLQQLNKTYGNRRNESILLKRSTSIGSLSTTRQSNTSKTKPNPSGEATTILVEL